MHFQIISTPDWQSHKAVAFDFEMTQRRERVFFPKSQIIERDGAEFVSDWIVGKKVEELVAKGYSPDEVELELGTVIDRDCFVETERPQQDTPAVVQAKTIREIFENAAANLKFPKIRIEADGKPIQLRRAGDRAKQPGVIWVDNGRGWDDPDKRTYGAIDLEGNFRPSRGIPSEVLAAIVALNADPVARLESHGRLTGNCSCCGRDLTDPESVARGIGPVCASRFF